MQIIPTNGNHSKYFNNTGYVYVKLQSDNNLNKLLQSCVYDYTNEWQYSFKRSQKGMKHNKVQIIASLLNSHFYIKCPWINKRNTIFVQGLYGKLNRKRLAYIVNELFGILSCANNVTNK